MKAIAVDLDDVLNNFTETLHGTQFVREATCSLSDEAYQDYLGKVRRGWIESGNLLSTEYSYFRYQIHQQCYELAQARLDGVRFVQWLRQAAWRIVICTYRDLRRAEDCTRKWLADNAIPFDYLFMTGNKIGFCKAWGIQHLIDDEPRNSVLGERFGVNVYYPAQMRPSPSQNLAPAACAARGFRTFDEIKAWIQE